MPRTYIDLHTHTTASDGSDSPEELIRKARKANVTTIAVTDHDTTQGLEEAMATGKDLGVNVIPGCELSVKTEYGELHLVALWLDPEGKNLQQAMEELRRNRAERNKVIVEKLQELGFSITYEDVLDAAGEGSVGRPHIAKVLVKSGQVSGFPEAFHVYLGDGGKAYAPKRILTPKEGIELLKKDGASVSLAHMRIHRYPLEWMEDMVATMKSYGLDALEAYHSEHSAFDVREVVGCAKRHGLALTGGSDYHGAVKPNIALGRGRGSLYVPPFVLDDLRARRERQGLPV